MDKTVVCPGASPDDIVSLPIAKQKEMDELITLAGELNMKETVDKVVSLIQSKGFKVFGRIDHSAEAAGQGLFLNPTELIIFGNPQVGTYLMQDMQSCGIDLPAKILVWRDGSGKVWLAYNKMEPLRSKHHLTDKSNNTLKKIEEVTAGICLAASKKDRE